MNGVYPIIYSYLTFKYLKKFKSPTLEGIYFLRPQRIKQTTVSSDELHPNWKMGIHWIFCPPGAQSPYVREDVLWLDMNVMVMRVTRWPRRKASRGVEDWEACVGLERSSLRRLSRSHFRLREKERQGKDSGMWSKGRSRSICLALAF